MKNAFESMLEGQKKVLDLWNDYSKKAMSFGAPAQETKQNETPDAILKDYFNQQKDFFEETLKSFADGKPNLSASTDIYNRWVATQKDFSERWLKAASSFNPNQMEFKVPEFKAQEAFKPLEDGWKQWLAASEKANEWIQTNILSKMPEEMQGHYRNFTSSYTDLYKHWENFQKMIQLGLNEKELVEKYFSTNTYQDFINKFMGFKSFGNADELLNNVNKFFEEFSANASKFSPTFNDLNENWKKMLQQVADADVSPMFKTVLDLNNRLNAESQPFLNVLSEGKEAKMLRILKDIQFNYVAYIVKSNELQSNVYKAGSTVLPEVLKKFAAEYKDKQQVPNYQEFYNQYTNALEDAITVVLESQDYSTLQGDVAKSGITVKSKYDELVELMLSDFPFVMKSQMDDVALENATLRRKLRELEAKMNVIELKLGTSSAATTTTITTKSSTTTLNPTKTVYATTAATAAAPATNGNSKDDLKKIEGIGPKIEELLNGAGIKTFWALAKANVEQLQTILTAAGSRYKIHDPATWAEQAALAAKGEWTSLEKWQNELKGGLVKN